MAGAIWSSISGSSMLRNIAWNSGLEKALVW